MPTYKQLKNLPIDNYETNMFLLWERTLDRLHGMDLQAIVIDELDMFVKPSRVLLDAFWHIDAKIYICGSPIKNYGLSPLMFLGIINQDTDIVDFGTKEMAEAAFKSKEFVTAFISPGTIGVLKCTTS